MISTETKTNISESMKINPPVLCYVNDPWAYFTTQPLCDQWGDDWNDTPYEHNAGNPYVYGEHDRKAGLEPWEIIKVAWDGAFLLPRDGCFNSPWSVEQINQCMVPWLSTNVWYDKKPIKIFAGTTLSQFCELINETNGNVYIKDNWTKRLNI